MVTMRRPPGVACRSWLALLLLLGLLGSLRPGAALATADVGAMVAPAATPADGVAAQELADEALPQMRRPEVQWSPVGAIRSQSVDRDQSARVGDRVRTGPAASAGLV